MRGFLWLSMIHIICNKDQNSNFVSLKFCFSTMVKVQIMNIHDFMSVKERLSMILSVELPRICILH